MTKPARPRSKTDHAPSLAASAASAMAHRAFPVVTGLWFAVLFGMGAVVAGGEALASLAGHLHLPAIIPSAAPPLGTTAHILIAIGLTGLGAVFGVVLGLVLHARATGASLSAMSRIKAGLARARTARSAPKPGEPVLAVPVDSVPTPTPRVRNRDAHPDAPPRRPLVVTEDVLPYHAPEQTVTTPPAWTSQVIESDSARDLGANHVLDHGETPLGAFMATHPAAHVLAQAAEVPPFLAGSFGEAPPLAQSGIYGSGEAIVLPPETGAPTEFVHAHPVPLDDAALAAEPVFHVAPPAFHTAPTPLASQAVTAPHDPIVEVPVASLGLVQLIERLALAITVRQAHRAELGYHAVPAQVVKTDEPLLRSKPSRLGRVNEAPVAASEPATQLHDPLSHGADQATRWADGAADDALPPRFLRGPLDRRVVDTSVLEATVPAPAEDTFVAPHSIFGAIKPDDEPKYSSLVNMAMVRPELAARLPDGPGTDAAYSHAPVVPFPVPTGENVAPAPMRGSSDQADRALRDALATLRRMSAQR